MSSVITDIVDVPMVDVRVPRFSAWVTTAVLAVVLLTAGAAPVPATALLAAQAVVFALGTRGRNPYGQLFTRVVRMPATEFEPAAPVRFAQTVGLAFAVVGTLALVVGAATVGLVAVGLALVAALLNAAFGLCLGCELYLIVLRTTRREGATT